MDLFFNLLILFFLVFNGFELTRDLVQYWIDRKYPQPTIKSLNNYLDTDGNVIITKDDLDNLLKENASLQADADFLACLIDAGVEDWENYDDVVIAYEESVLGS